MCCLRYFYHICNLTTYHMGNILRKGKSMMATFTLALINNHEDGKLFFETYNIPYQVITRGENKGKLRVKATRSLDGQAVLDARKELEYAGYGFLADHSNVFRDEDDRTVVTFSPYYAVPNVIEVPVYDVEVSDYSIYSYWTKTIVMRRR